MQEKRAFFRFDVFVPTYIEAMSEEGACLIDAKECVTLSGIEKAHQQLNTELAALFKYDKYQKNGGVALFDELNSKLEFMIWLMTSIAKGHDPRTDDEFAKHYHQQQQYKIPHGGHESAFVSLLQAFYIRVDELIAELLEVIEKSVQGRVFIFHKEVYEDFAAQHYLSGLSVQAEKGNWLASSADLLCKKLNVYEGLLRSLKEVGHSLANSESWPIERVNLAAGGFSLYMERDIQVGDSVCALFVLDDQLILAQAKCVVVEPTSAQDGMARFAFHFESISAEDEAHIVRFLTSKELENRADES